MRVFQRLFTNHVIKKKDIKVIKIVKPIKTPPSFYKIPYDDQYESRDFIRDNKNDKNDKNDKK